MVLFSVSLYKIAIYNGTNLRDINSLCGFAVVVDVNVISYVCVCVFSHLKKNPFMIHFRYLLIKYTFKNFRFDLMIIRVYKL